MSHDLQDKESNTGTNLFSVQQTPVKLEHGTDEAFVEHESLVERTSDSGNLPVLPDSLKTEITELCLISNGKIKTIPICHETGYILLLVKVFLLIQEEKPPMGLTGHHID